MFELQNRAIEERQSVDEAGVTKLVDERVGEPSGQGLRDDQIRHVTAGDHDRAFDAEKIRCPLLQFSVQGMIAARQSRSGYVQPISVQALVSRAKNCGMAGQAK